MEQNRHVGALNCLINKGEVAYVSLQDAQEFFSMVRQKNVIALALQASPIIVNF